MEPTDLIQFVKDKKGSGPWTISSLLQAAVPLLMKVQLYTNMTQDQKKKLVLNLVKKMLVEERAELDKKIDLTADQKKIEAAIFEKVLVAVDEVLPAVLDLIPIPELPKAVKRWFSLMPCSMASVGLFASENLVSLADGVKTMEAVAEKVVDAVPALKPLVKEAEKVVDAAVATVTEIQAVAVAAQAAQAVAVQAVAVQLVSNTPVATAEPTTAVQTTENKA
jgi:hypothetical protein